MKLNEAISLNSEIWTILNFWDMKTCNDIIDDLECSNLFPTLIRKDDKLETLDENLLTRNSSKIIYTSTELASEIWEIIKSKLYRIEAIKSPIGINREFRFYKYNIGQEFKPHQDAPCILNENERSFFSLLIYLNDNFNGGVTTFNNLEITPIQGSAVFFNHDIEHSSTTITKGTKYILRTDIICKY